MKNLKLILGIEVGLIAVLCIVVAGLFFFFTGKPATPNLPPTANPALVPTQTPEPPTATPLPDAPGMSGTQIEALPDGMTRFTDYDAGYEITFPVGWLVVRPGSQEFQDALANEAAKNPDLKNALESALEFDPNLQRVLAYDTKPGSMATGVLGYIVVRWEVSDTLSIDEELYRGIPQIEADPQYQGKGIRVVASNKGETANKIPVGRVGMRWNMKNDLGEMVQIYMPITFFQAQKSMVFLTLTTPNDLRPEVEPDFTAIVDTIKLLGQ
jgi:hypothetical protein